MESSVLVTKSENFALRIIKMCRVLHDKKEFIISNQIFRSGTSIGANIAESVFASSKADFINKLHIALKETRETEYWLNLLLKSETIKDIEYKSMINDLKEILKILISTVKTSKQKQG